MIALIKIKFCCKKQRNSRNQLHPESALRIFFIKPQHRHHNGEQNKQNHKKCGNAALHAIGFSQKKKRFKQHIQKWKQSRQNQNHWSAQQIKTFRQSFFRPWLLDFIHNPLFCSGFFICLQNLFHHTIPVHIKKQYNTPEKQQQRNQNGQYCDFFCHSVTSFFSSSFAVSTPCACFSSQFR